MRTVSLLKGPTLCVRLGTRHADILIAHCAAMGVSGPELIRRLIDSLGEQKSVEPRRVDQHVAG